MERQIPRSEDDRTEELDIMLDDGDADGEAITLTASGLTKAEKQYLLDQVHDLQVLDQELDDAQERGDETAVQTLAQEYDQRRAGVTNYLQSKGIPYQMAKGKEAKTRVHKAERCAVCKEEKAERQRDGKERQKATGRHYVPKRSRSQGKERTRERTKSE